MEPIVLEPLRCPRLGWVQVPPVHTPDRVEHLGAFKDAAELTEL